MYIHRRSQASVWIIAVIKDFLCVHNSPQREAETERERKRERQREREKERERKYSGGFLIEVSEKNMSASILLQYSGKSKTRSRPRCIYMKLQLIYIGIILFYIVV